MEYLKKNRFMVIILVVELLGMVALGILGYGQYFWIYGVFIVLTVIGMAVYAQRKGKEIS
jgi:general stress protein CsbA